MKALKFLRIALKHGKQIEDYGSTVELLLSNPGLLKTVHIVVDLAATRANGRSAQTVNREYVSMVWKLRDEVRAVR